MLEQYYRIGQAAGVNINLLPNGESVVNLCSIVIKDNKLEFEKKTAGLSSLDELSKQLSPKTCAALNLSGKGVLHKQIDKIEQIDQNGFTRILPNANMDDFYIQNFISGEKSFVSIMRKADADKWIGALAKQGFTVLMLSLGPFPVYNIISQLNVYDADVIFDGHVILRNENQEWTDYRYKESASAEFPLKIESETIDQRLIIPYAIVFQLVLASRLNVIKADVPILEKAFDELNLNKKLRVKAFLVLSAFFVVLLINFFAFSWLASSNSKLAYHISRSAQNTSSLQEINDQVNHNEGLLKQLGWDGGINKSVLIDQLASLLPQEISWQEIIINPVDLTASRAQRSLSFMDRKIRVTGNSEKIIPVNEWIARIKTRKWVKNVQMDSYTYNNELNTGQFTITIDY